MDTTKLPTDYTVIDVETTGLQPGKDKLIEVSAVRIRDGNVTETFQHYINPYIPVPEDTPTNLTNDFLQNYPTADTVLPQFLTFLGSDTLVGHNITFDLGFLRTESGKFIPNDTIDTCTMSRRCLELPDYKLSTLCDFFGIQHDSDHTANGDCLSAFELYERLLCIKGIQEEQPRRSHTKRPDNHQDPYTEPPVSNYTESTAIMNALAEKKPDLCTGYKIVFTGVFLRLSRITAEKFIVATGGETGNLTKNTSCLVQGRELNAASNGKSRKTVQAEERGIPIISEEDFISKLREVLHAEE